MAALFFIISSQYHPGTKVILTLTRGPLCCYTEDKCQERGRALQETNMYRFLFRTVNAARSSSLTVYESCVLPAKCDKAAALVFRVSNRGGIKALSTSSVRLCEKKNDVAASHQDDKTHADKEADPTETPTLETQKAQDDSKVKMEMEDGEVKMAKQSEQEPVVLKTDGGSTSQQQADDETKKVGKSGKEGLLQLLGTMSVRVTTKKKPYRPPLWPSLNPPSHKNPKPMESTKSMFEKATEETSSSQTRKSDTLDPELVEAASAAASTLPDSSQAESELLRKLQQQETISEAQKKGDMSYLHEMISKMKIGRRTDYRRGASQTFDLRFDRDEQELNRGEGPKARLFSRKRLNIFSPTADEDAVETVARPTLWDIDFANELSLLTGLKPRNGLEEMLQWTKDGKMWQYPINNEAGLEEEASVPFHEHIFLEKHLEEGFPSKGPVRHFMELVLAGLSKNPYLTVQQKQEHISWFRDYFHEKQEVLKEADVSLN
ncbi:LOW QUALITY PROTEIN: 28S ribosomal protein S31, mitochondrial [Centropristis striata]|uniref:LOW QUALITY PROTEIN: 28S ribosomal protein S31, mitochondrial n=1 Tax=Centropristis striata TaxID=184440 RepID=UPI0027DF3BA5|nr:LOW QUALITY PROTEIN: 28S ribosomal protein S31, mitochondrial [Centropristis striata]